MTNTFPHKKNSTVFIARHLYSYLYVAPTINEQPFTSKLVAGEPYKLVDFQYKADDNNMVAVSFIDDKGDQVWSPYYMTARLMPAILTKQQYQNERLIK